LREYIRCWEEHDLDGLVARLHADVVFAMPPYANWLRGSGTLCTFLKQPPFAPFWSRGLAAWRTRANGGPALVWYAPGADEFWQPHSIHLVRFEGDQLNEAINFIGNDYLVGFNLPAALSRDAISAWSR
jgi:RNA polymerase sigma-70 factor, ECF subfamily